MFDRSGDFSPTNDEKSVEKESPKTSLLTEAAYLANSKEDSDQSKDIVSGISEIAFVLKSTTFDTKVANFKSGITNPLLDFMTTARQEDKDIGTRRHKENALAYSGIRKAVERSSANSTKAVTGSMRDAYYGMTKSVFSAIGTVIKPLTKVLTVGLFGSKKERTVVEAVDEQTQFLRSGRILDSSTMLSRFMRRGVVGNIGAAAAGAAGIGRGAAQSAENKRGSGEQLKFREKLVTTMGVQLGWFKQFDRRDTKKSFDKNNPAQQQVNILDRIRLGVEGFLEFFRYASEIQLNELGEIRHIAGGQTNVLKEAIQSSNIKAADQLESAVQNSSFKVADRLEAANDASASVFQNVARAAGDGLQQSIETSNSKIVDQVESSNKASMGMYQYVARTASNNLSYYNNRQSSILADVKDEVKEANKPKTSAYEHRALFIQNAQYAELQKANELAAEQAEAAADAAEAGSKKGGGLIGMATSLGGMLFNSKTAKVIGKLGKKFIISPIMGAIKAGGKWLMKNGFKLILRAPFAKIFAVVAIGGLFYKYLARPLIDWFDNKFNTDIGGAIDRFGTMISDKFFGILDWIREKMASVPVIGKYFEKDDPVPEVPADQLKSKKKKEEEGGFFSGWGWGGDDDKKPEKSFSETYRPDRNGTNRDSGGVVNGVKKYASESYKDVKESGSSVVNWYGNQWSDIGNIASKKMGELAQQGGEYVQSGIDRIKGYDPEGVKGHNRQEMSRGQMAQNALAATINPVMDQNPTISDDMTMAALESRDAMLQQVNELKEQRKAMEQQNRHMIEIMSSVAGNTQQGVMATYMATKANQNAIKNKSAYITDRFD